MQKGLNKLVVIGYMGTKRAYLNIDRKEAIKRYAESNDISVKEFDENLVEEIEFDEEFGTYEVWQL